MSGPELRANSRPRPLRATPPSGGGSSSTLLLAILIAALVGAASWAVKERDDKQKLVAENARLTAENEQLHTALSRQQQEAAKMRERLLNVPSTRDRTIQRPRPTAAPRLTPRSAPRTYPRDAPTPRPAPRSSSQNTAIRNAEIRCGVYGYGTVDERACRRREWQKMRDKCASFRSKEAFVGPQQRDAHRQLMRMWCDAERQFKIIH